MPTWIALTKITFTLWTILKPKFLDRHHDRMFLYTTITSLVIQLFRSVLRCWSCFAMVQLWQIRWKGDTPTINLPAEWVSSVPLVYWKDNLDVSFHSCFSGMLVIAVWWPLRASFCITILFTSRQNTLSHQAEMTIVPTTVGLAREREILWLMYDISSNNVWLRVIFVPFCYLVSIVNLLLQ